MATLYRDTGYSLTHLIEDIKHGNIALPDIQRPFVWNASQVRDLFDSMYRGFPVGTLMFWETGAEVGTRQVGGGETARVPKLLIVDGQQRLTALFAVIAGRAVLTKEFAEKRIQIAFRPEDETFEVASAAIKSDPAFIPDITALWNDGYKSNLRSFLNRLDEAADEPLGDDEHDRLEERIDRVRDLRDFRFQVIELGANADEELVSEIFVRINSKGVQLNQANFILTLMSVHWEKGRRQLEDFARAAVDRSVEGPSPRNPFIDPKPDQLLRVAVGLAFKRGRLRHVYSLLRGKDLETGHVSADRRVEQFQQLEHAQEQVLDLTNWHEFLKVISSAGFRSSKMVTSDNALLYSYILWLVGRCDFGIDLRTLRGVIGRWFFMAHTTGRYTSSPESQIEHDLSRLRGMDQSDGAAFCEELDRIVRSNFTGDYWEISLPNRLDSSASKSPALCAYWAALNLLDAELLFSDQRISKLSDPDVNAPRGIERHHLFPKKYLAQLGVTEHTAVNAIGNLAYLDWPDNAEISADAPHDYWPELTAGLSPERLQRHTYWHALPVGWEQLDYASFVKRRRDLIAGVVKDGFETLWERNDKPSGPTSLDDLINAGESQRVEYKSTARWNVRADRADKKMEHVIVKTVCGFLNAEGGTLLIGVDDDGNPLGLNADLQTLGSKQDLDGFELWLRQHLNNSLSVTTAGTVRISFDTVSGADACVVTVAASGKPAYAKPLEGSNAYTEFWVREGNRTVQLHGEAMDDYKQTHWG